MLEICAVGGYYEVGRNMTAVKVDDACFILDMGINLTKYIELTEDEDIHDITEKQLMHAGAIPDDSTIADWRDKVKAIIPTHAHLDHVGALPFMAHKYKAPIIATPFTHEIIKAICKDDRLKLKNKTLVLQPNSHYDLNDVRVEFIHITHSTPQTIVAALHTKQGTILYSNDFKLDNFPVLGKKPNYRRLQELKNVKVLICDCLRAQDHRKTPSENVAREMLKDILLGVHCEQQAIFITTFSSHIARLKSIIEFGKHLRRKVVFLGRSLAKYTQAAENVGLVTFSKEVDIYRYGNEIKKALKRIAQEPQKYLVVLTGHQGEPKSVLGRIARGQFPFAFKPKDVVIFSSTIIPNDLNKQNRKELETILEEKHVRIFRDIHQSGHASREDLRDFLHLVRPEYVIPAHGEEAMTEAMVSLALEEGIKVIKLRNGERVKIPHGL